MIKTLDACAWRMVTVLGVCCTLGLAAWSDDVPGTVAESALDQGYSELYNLGFGEAQKDFAAWEKSHPDDPVGPVSEAAGLPFSEFHRLGVLEAQFYENDEAFAGRPKLTADPAVRERFQNAIVRAENLAHVRLQKDPQDRDALLR